MATQPNIPQTPMVNIQTGYITREWLYWILNPQIQTVVVGSPIGVSDGGTGLTGGTSGGILGFIGPTTMASSAELEANHVVLGGGAGLTPYTMPSLGTSGQLLTSNGAGLAPTFQNPATSGTVTSVALAAPTEFTVSGSPVTSSGTLTFTKANQNANIVYAGPTTGVAAQPTFRSLVTADLPDTAVTPGSYTSANITVNQKGVITSAANGSGGGITGPGSSTDRGVPSWNGTTGSALRDNSGVVIDSSGALQLTSGNATAATTSAVSVFGAGGNTPSIGFTDSTRSANNRKMDYNFNSGIFSMRFVNDAYSLATNFLQVTGGFAAGISSVAFTGPLSATSIQNTPIGSTTRSTIAATSGDFSTTLAATSTITGGASILTTGGAAPSVASSRIAMSTVGGFPNLDLIDAARTANNKAVNLAFGGGTFLVRFINDAYSATVNAMEIVGGQAAGVTSVTFPNGNVVITNNLTVNGNTTIGNASGDTLTVAPNAVTWSNNPTHSGNHTWSGTASHQGATTIASTTATPAGGSTSARLLFGTTAGFGIYYGSGAPSVSAAKGSWYMRSDGSGTNDRAYINTDGATTWTAMVTVA